MDLNSSVSEVSSREQLAAFLKNLVVDLRENPHEWENGDLPSFLDAAAAWVEDMDRYFANRGELLPDPPGWRTFAEIFMAAKFYE